MTAGTVDWESAILLSLARADFQVSLALEGASEEQAAALRARQLGIQERMRELQQEIGLRSEN
ncbi:MAG TPA: hypothetical protein VFJ78_03450 [Gaiellaceae bacterium]|nr:hypothetical protein [Gaiellaceae bacterium]